MVVVPVAAPRLITVAALKALTVVTLALKRFKEAVLLFTLPPSTFKSPSRSSVAFLMVVVPLAAPSTILVP